MSVCSVPESSDQQHCKFCGGIIPPGDRRPREYCSDAHRQAAYRAASRVHAAADEAFTHPANSNAPTAESTKSGAENSNKINGRNFVTDCPSVPLDLFGRGFRWPGAKVNGNAVQIAAAVDAELGAGGLAIMSPDGVVAVIVPRRTR